MSTNITISIKKWTIYTR